MDRQNAPEVMTLPWCIQVMEADVDSFGLNPWADLSYTVRGNTNSPSDFVFFLQCCVQILL